MASIGFKWPWPNLCEICGGHVETLELWQEPTDGGLVYGHRTCLNDVTADPAHIDGLVRDSNAESGEVL